MLFQRIAPFLCIRFVPHASLKVAKKTVVEIESLGPEKGVSFSDLALITMIALYFDAVLSQSVEKIVSRLGQ